MYALFLAAALSLANPGSEAAAPPAPETTPSQVMAMPPEMRQRLHADVLARPAPQQQRLEQLLHFMLDADALGIVYDESATYSVAQTYAARRANCLSLTLVFLAIAREAGLEAQPQEIQDTLAWHRDETTIYRNSHVNARVHVNSRHLTVDASGDTLISVDKPTVVSEQRLLAHYFNNLSMDQLARGDPVTGLDLMALALAQDPTYAPLWSNAGVLRVHLGDTEGARRAYLKALEIDPEEDGALFNMVSLSHRLGDAKAEGEYRARLDKVQNRDPLYHFMLALDAEARGDYPQAIARYQRAIRLHPDEHRFHSALAGAYLKAGNTKRAIRALMRAQAVSDGAVRAAYRAKLQELKRSSN
jgi:Flp pilus assembly protein TadD